MTATDQNCPKCNRPLTQQVESLQTGQVFWWCNVCRSQFAKDDHDALCYCVLCLGRGAIPGSEPSEFPTPTMSGDELLRLDARRCAAAYAAQRLRAPTTADIADLEEHFYRTFRSELGLDT